MLHEPMTAPQTMPPSEQPTRHPEWQNWRWQMQNRIHSVEALREWIDPSDDELEAIEATKNIFRWNSRKIVSTLENGPNGTVLAGCPGRLPTLLSSLAGQS